MDAGVTQRRVAQQIRQCGGQYLMVVKKNHPQMYAELALFFEQPGILADAEQYVRTMISAGVDAAVVQDVGMCRLIRRHSPDFPIHASIDFKTVASLRDQAAACHASQGGGMPNRGLMSWFRRVAPSRETYMKHFPPPVQGKFDTDLFEDII